MAPEPGHGQQLGTSLFQAVALAPKPFGEFHAVTALQGSAELPRPLADPISLPAETSDQGVGTTGQGSHRIGKQGMRVLLLAQREPRPDNRIPARDSQ